MSPHGTGRQAPHGTKVCEIGRSGSKLQICDSQPCGGSETIDPGMQQHPVIIQGGMGAGVSSWRLAQAVSRLGQLGVVSGTALDEILVRRLQDGDPGGHSGEGSMLFLFRPWRSGFGGAYYIPAGKPPRLRTGRCQPTNEK